MQFSIKGSGCSFDILHHNDDLVTPPEGKSANHSFYGQSVSAFGYKLGVINLRIRSVVQLLYTSAAIGFIDDWRHITVTGAKYRLAGKAII